MDFAELLRELIREQGLSGRALARRLPCDSSLISRLACGRQRPSARIAARLDVVLGAGGALVEAAQPVGGAGVRAEAAAGRAGRAALPAVRAGWEGRGDGEMRRRELLGAMVAGPLAVQLEQIRRHLDGIPESVSERDADEWEQVTARYARMLPVTPAPVYLPHLLADAGEVTDRVLAASGGVRARLVRSAAQIAALTALGLSSLGDQLASARWWRTSARVAEDSADRELVALIAGRRAVNSVYWPGVDVLSLADRALQSCGGRACAGEVFAHNARALRLAGTGRRAEALAAMTAHQAAWERLPGPGEAGSEFGQPERRVLHTRAWVLAKVGGTGEAMTAIDAYLKAAESAGGRSRVEFLRAESLIRAGDVDGGARHCVRVLASAGVWRGEHEVVSAARTALDAVPLPHASRRTVLEAREVLELAAGQG